MERTERLEHALAALTESIRPADRDAMERAEKRQAELAKPPGSLGRLEKLSVKLAGITGKVHNSFPDRALLVFCADNGVTEEGVASAPRSVTLAQTVNLTRGKTGAAVLARAFGCRLLVCDVGVDADIREPAVIGRKIAYGTKNIAKGPAMTREEALRAILTGAEQAEKAVREGAGAVGVGEMGIGNTTTSAAVLSVLTGAAVRDVTGRGAGITDEAYRTKLTVIEKAVSLNRPDPADPVDVLSKVGGYDLAAMTGAFLGAAKLRVPAVADGFISVVAALSAARLCPFVRDYLIPSHASYEIGYRLAADALGLEPLFDLEMRLGEGSGVPIAMTMIDAACAVINDMATFEEAGIDDGYLDPIREGDAFSVGRGEGRGNR